MKTYIIRAKLKQNKRTYRDIEIREDILLDDFAKAIVTSFEFDFDHLFGFGNNPDSFYNSTAQYEVKHDDFFGFMFEEEKAGDVGTTTIAGVDFFKKEKDKMSFLFDFGDDWGFEIELIGFGERERKVKYPRVLKVNGKAPQQYPEYD